MKAVITTILFLVVTICHATVIDTIDITFSKTIVLIFDSNVIHYDVGTEDILVSHDKKVVKLGSGIKNHQETSLFVETESGYYSFILRYKNNPPTLTHHFTAKQASVSKTSTDSTLTTPEKQKNNIVLSPEDKKIIQEKCDILFKESPKIFDIGVVESKFDFILQDIRIQGDYLLFKVSIRNKSNIDYDIDLIRHTIKGKKGVVKQRSVHETSLEDNLVFIYNDDIKEIKGKSEVIKIYVFKKFTFASDKRMYFEIWENGGERIVDFNITKDFILDVEKI